VGFASTLVGKFAVVVAIEFDPRRHIMATHIVFQDCEDNVKHRVEAYWEKKLPRLLKLLSSYRPDQFEIRLTVVHHQEPRFRYELRGVIHLSSGTLVAEVHDKDPHAAIDKIVDTLIPEIKRHKELVRKDFVFKRKSRDREALSAAGPVAPQQKKVGPKSKPRGKR
jgi:ribosome-associated translation inhibitor RaiA